eukprot:1445749-Rhodomonas_salina.4
MPGGEKVDGPGAEMTEEMMMLIALQQREKMALPEGSKVIVFGALDRLGQIVVRMLAANGRYKPAIQTSEGYLDQMRMTVDGVEPVRNEPDRRAWCAMSGTHLAYGGTRAFPLRLRWPLKRSQRTFLLRSCA